MKKDIDCNDKIHGKINGKSSTPATAKSDPKKNKKEVDDIKSSTNHDDDEMKVSAIDTLVLQTAMNMHIWYNIQERKIKKDYVAV